MASYKINFTKASLNDITPPKKPAGSQGGVFDTYRDEKQPGLILIVSHGGAKTFYLYSKVDGRPERIKLGKFPDLSVDEARKKAQQSKGQIAGGINPNEKKRSLNQEITFGELFEKFINQYAKLHKKSWKGDEGHYRRYLKDWEKKKISAIRNEDITRKHAQIGSENGKYVANRMLALISCMFGKAIDWGWKGQNPATGIKKFAEKSRDRFLQPHELPRFFEALNAEHNETARDYVMLSLLTGARRSNVLAMRWDEINLTAAEWRIPETKNGESQVVVLSSMALDLLKKRQRMTNSPWVFPNPDSSTGHLQDPKKAWQRILDRTELFELIELIGDKTGVPDAILAETKLEAANSIAKSLTVYRQRAKMLELNTDNIGIKNLRLHDLRRSLGSWQAATGANTYVIGKTLGHKSQQATAVYARLNLDPVKESVERATEAILSAGKYGK